MVDQARPVDDDVRDLDAHLALPHLTEFAGLLDDLLDESGPIVIERVRRVAYSAR